MRRRSPSLAIPKRGQVNLRPLLFFIAGLLPLFSCGRAAPETIPAGAEQLQQAMHTFNEAFARADATALSELLTTNYLHTSGNRPAIGKEAWLEYVRSRKAQVEKGLLAIDNYQMLDVKVRLYGPAAVVSSRAVEQGLENGAPFDAAYRTSQFWVVENGQWKRAGFHDTQIR